MTTDSLLSLFGTNRKEAYLRYRHFVLEGVGKEIWSNLRNQIYLGDKNFVERMQAKVQVRGDVLTVPGAQRRPPAQSLDVIAASHGERNAAIVVAYATGAYSYREIAEHFGIHLATVGRIVRGTMQQCENWPRVVCERIQIVSIYCSK
ncbi:MAG: helix-turn-helix domain-containing protein [Candidatus Polarisedimenticolaceae bacterium]|nr:helix-turn-helix domain-containing protein [Candidatus Polarisedimenticolaceae bacterium]